MNGEWWQACLVFVAGFGVYVAGCWVNHLFDLRRMRLKYLAKYEVVQFRLWIKAGQPTWTNAGSAHGLTADEFMDEWRKVGVE